MGKRNLSLLAIINIVCILGLSNAYESPQYTVVHSESDFEIRLYTDSVWMSAPVKEISFRKATRDGFHSMSRILASYESYKKTEELTRLIIQEKVASEDSDVCGADELTQIIQRHLEEKKIKKLDISGLNQLEQQLHNFLGLARVRKAQLMMGVVKGLQEKETQLKKENKVIRKEIMEARMNGGDDAAALPLMDVQIA